ncbi:ABC transporter G family member 29-like isoform X2 [Herrania umbratica]|uniref:ABC transporter G family member 29-like isoform X2 n=1 Tax=Herrania umbratica TaxID=108875 RepID=A0A6J1B9S1_9ROSI|nr:ABC transporter G family member 29-like isoform X2 [Herrania umbratica]
MDGSENARTSRSRSGHNNLGSSIRSSLSWTSRRMEDVFAGASRLSGSSTRAEEEEEALRWAAIEKLPTYKRLRTSIIKSFAESSDHQDQGHGNRHEFAPREVDVRKLEMDDRQKFINAVFKVAEEDNEKFLKRFRNRVDKVGIQLPTVEVRFEHLSIQADTYMGSRALPTLPNVAQNIAELALGMVGIRFTKRSRLNILKDVSGIIKPSRMTLLLGPPASGKTTLLLALAGKLDPSLKASGEVSYNGYKLNEFVPKKTSAYISQHDVHAAEMTVKETLDFSARCQGVGSRYDLLSELARREKHAGIFPDAEVDLFMKATAIEGAESSLATNYILKVLGLDICQDTIVGDDMIRGVSGGQKKRVTTGEMIVGPTKTLLMDEISTGLDSSTTYQIVKCLQQIAHLTDATIFMSLLQPAPETFDLFDDVVLISEGQIVYQGPKKYVVEFFESCGFKCPERKGTADFLQEVTSKKDQAQYWADRSKPYRYISVPEFANSFKKFHVGVQLANELSVPFNKSQGHKAALVFSRYSVPKLELLKACWDKEVLSIKRNSFFYVFKISRIIIVAFLASTMFLRTRMHHRNEQDGVLYNGALLFSLITNVFNAYPEISLMIARLPVFFKQRDLLLYPAWAFTIPLVLTKIPIAIFETTAWMAVTYYPTGFAPEAERFFKTMMVVLLINQLAASLFRLIAGVCRTIVVSNAGGMLVLMFGVFLGGFILPRTQIRKWWKWGYWVSPWTYSYNALAVNEFYAPRWMNRLASDNITRLGVAVLESLEVYRNKNWYWIGAGALLGFIILFNVLFTLALTYLNPPSSPQAVIPEDSADEMESNREMAIRGISSESNSGSTKRNANSTQEAATKGMVLPFTPLAMSFNKVNYHVDMPSEMKAQGVTEDKLQLLREVTGAFRPGVLTALMGVSGAGKTTLMDVLAERKTGGYIEGDVRISGFPKKQETFARVSGYCEQNDIHSPQITVRESLIYSAFLRLPKEIDKEGKLIFVDQVMELVELDNLKDGLVGLPGITGLSTEQRKRLTIAVELVANPSIIFMDEPTSGLDARAAAIVMRTVRNTVDTGRTVVCTIHQPSIDIFEAFDELLLMKRGGQVIFFGPLGPNSQKIVEYFEAIPGIPKIKEKYNPATWMLEVSSAAVEARLGIDFAEHYKSSSLYQQNQALVEELSRPPQGAKDLYFTTQYSVSMWGQFKCCLWKQFKTYWRTPEYNLVRFGFTLVAALMVGSIFWRVGTKMKDATQLTMITGAMYIAVMFLGVTNCQTVQPVVAIERTIFYRETAAGMYSAFPYALAQVIAEIPYVLTQSSYYALIIFAMIKFKWTAKKFFWFLFVNFFTFLYFTFYGMMTVAITPNVHVAAILAAAFYALFNLFSGFFIPRPRIPGWWIWYYWICPVAWTIYGLITSQYGEDEHTIKVPGILPDPTVKWYLEHHFGYHNDFMGAVAAALVGFAVFFAFMFALSIKILNFQIR